MKKILLLIFVLTGCSNPKEKIVEREKEVKVEMGKLDIKKSLLQHDELMFTHDNRDSLGKEWAQKK
jgi:PBP1b-binding outer membrane lipoprotein LpoB